MAVAYDSEVAEELPDATEGEVRLDLVSMLGMENIASDLDAKTLADIGERVCRETEIDEASRKEWLTRTRKGMDMALQESQPKDYPFPKASDIKFPLMTTAAIQFAARAYPAIIAGTDVVKPRIVGEDTDGEKRKRGQRIADHMSWQLLIEMPEWEEDVDRMLHTLPIVGCEFKKTYFDATTGRNRSMRCMAEDVIVNNNARSLETAPRITHRLWIYPHEIQERINAGVFLDFEYLQATQSGEDDRRVAEGDEDAPHEFYEQHRRYDLDGDEYPEPVIVTVHKASQTVCRIVAGYDENGIRVRQNGDLIGVDPIKYFTKIPFIPNPEGGFYDVGFAWVLGPINATINSIVNQLIDAGHLQNVGAVSGFVSRDLRAKGGSLQPEFGKWKLVDSNAEDLSKAFFSLPVGQPSPVLFDMLGLMIDAGKEVASINDVLMGDIKAQTMAPSTLLGLVEQSLKFFSGIYKRIYRALTDEYQKLYELNRKHFDPQAYMQFHDGPEVALEDYAGDPVDIIPVSDPSMVNDMQKLARADFLGTFKGEPTVNPVEITRRQFEAAGIPDMESLFVPQDTPPPPEMVAQLERLKAETALKLADADLKMLQIHEMAARIEKLLADTAKARTAAIKDLADAEAAEAGTQIQVYTAQRGALEQSRVVD